MPVIESTPQMVEAAYSRFRANLDIIRGRLNRPMTLAEKIVLAHVDDPQGQELDPGSAYLMLRPDRVAMQDATAQMALLQFMKAGRKEVAVPTTTHCDHLVLARTGAEEDTANARVTNREVYDFLQSVSAKYGIGFWGPGSGIIHQVVLENYAFPGGLMLGTDSHTPNAGGLGMCAVGVGGADAVDVMCGMPWEVLQPNRVAVVLTGEMSGWTAPKDVILRVLGELTVKGGTNRIVEYIGPGARTISATGKGTICNMGAELGATTSVFPYDERMEVYLRATERAGLAELANRERDLLVPDEEVEANPGKYYDVVVEIDLSKLEPHVVGPHTPDLARPVSEMAKAVKSEDYPDTLSVSLIGSCTNSSYEDICRAADVAEQAAGHNTKMRSELLVSPGSDQIMATIERDGQMAALQAVGATVLANACGPCIGQWQRDSVKKGEKNSIITSFNRNFPGRNDANPETLAFIASPEIVMAYGLAGSLSFNPLKDTLKGADGGEWKLEPPRPAPEIPQNGFVKAVAGYRAPAADGSSVAVVIDPASERLAALGDFPTLTWANLGRMPLLLKTRGKTTTDHISPAGPWLKYRGHLDNISNNMFTGAINAFNGERGKTRNPITGAASESVPDVARAIKAADRRWVVVGDENYGEGSSREHAAMCPRWLGAAAIIVRSFARIHETNLKKQGALPLTFAHTNDYEKVRETDEVSLRGVVDIAPGSQVSAVFHHEDGSTDEAVLNHSFNAEQIEWLHAGGALPLLAKSAG